MDACRCQVVVTFSVAELIRYYQKEVFRALEIKFFIHNAPTHRSHCVLGNPGKTWQLWTCPFLAVHQPTSLNAGITSAYR